MTAFTCPRTAPADDDVERGGLAQAGADLDVIARALREQDTLLLERALSDQTLAERNVVADLHPLPVGVAREELEAPARRLVSMM